MTPDSRRIQELRAEDPRDAPLISAINEYLRANPNQIVVFERQTEDDPDVLTFAELAEFITQVREMTNE